jgi:NhaP-type Na+/H+ or K+/H+ antiporter
MMFIFLLLLFLALGASRFFLSKSIPYFLSSRLPLARSANLINDLYFSPSLASQRLSFAFCVFTKGMCMKKNEFIKK